MTALSILAQDSDGGGSGIVSLLVLLLIPLAMYFLLIRPQRKRMKDAASLQSSLGVGDEVITSSGVYGFITGEEDDLFWLEVDDDVQLRIAKAAIQGKAGPAKDEPKDESKDDDADDESKNDTTDTSDADDDDGDSNGSSSDADDGADSTS